MSKSDLKRKSQRENCQKYPRVVSKFHPAFWTGSAAVSLIVYV